jgi:hypothetical protein
MNITKITLRPLLLEYGMWDTVRVDHGTEAYLMLAMQDYLKEYRTNTSRPPYIQSPSTSVSPIERHRIGYQALVYILQNHPIERIWVEINGRVNYPIKLVLNNLTDKDEIDMDCPTTKYCVSWVAMHVAQFGCTQVISSWNNHRIPGKDTAQSGSRKPSIMPLI